jgi:hypothetical protein
MVHAPQVTVDAQGPALVSRDRGNPPTANRARGKRTMHNAPHPAAHVGASLGEASMFACVWKTSSPRRGARPEITTRSI